MSRHFEHSSYREKLIEHLFIGELLKLSWQSEKCDLEVGKPEVDNAGYDAILEANGVVRHVQLKATYLGGKTARQKVHVNLSTKPSGCIVWIYFDEQTLELGPFYFFGGEPGAPLPDISEAKVARHTKGDQSGYKSERPNIREINKGAFQHVASINEVYQQLFGVCETTPLSD